MASATRLVGVGTFVVGGLLLFAVGLFMIGDRQMAFADRVTVYTEFTRITGLQPGAVVRVSGARAGTVRQIVPPASPSGRFRVEVEITDNLHQLVRTDSVATIEAEGLVGGSYLGIAIGSPNMPRVAPGAVLPSREPFEIADLVAQMSATIVKVNATVDVLTGQVQQALDTVVVTVDNANALITTVSDDVALIAQSGARISRDLADITTAVQHGDGTMARLLHDDELYQRLVAVAKNGESIAGDARVVMRDVRETVNRFKGADGNVTGLTDDLRQTLAEARSAMSGFADNMDALKRNFLFRGFFNRRGYFDLAALAPEEYRRGALTDDGRRSPQRVWLNADVLFTTSTPGESQATLTPEGQQRLDLAMGLFLERLPAGVLMVEGYSARGSRDDSFRESRARAAMVRDYLVAHFGVDPERVGTMPLGANPMEPVPLSSWNGEGIALAYFAEAEAR